jgi:hypothetical protein
MASGLKLFECRANNAEPPSANSASPDKRNQRPVLDFDPTTDESAVWGNTMDPNYGAGGITVQVTGSFSSDTTNTHTCDVDVSFERVGDAQQDLDSDSFAAVKTATLTVNSTSGLTDVATVAFANNEIDGILAGEEYRVKATVDASDSDFTGDFELLSMTGKET